MRRSRSRRRFLDCRRVFCAALVALAVAGWTGDAVALFQIEVRPSIDYGNTSGISGARICAQVLERSRDSGRAAVNIDQYETVTGPSGRASFPIPPRVRGNVDPFSGTVRFIALAEDWCPNACDIEFAWDYTSENSVAEVRRCNMRLYRRDHDRCLPQGYTRRTNETNAYGGDSVRPIPQARNAQGEFEQVGDQRYVQHSSPRLICSEDPPINRQRPDRPQALDPHGIEAAPALPQRGTIDPQRRPGGRTLPQRQNR